MFQFEKELDFFIIIEVHGYKPSRPAPVCSNPSHFNYADPGDDAEWDEVKFYYMDGQVKVQIKDEFFCSYLEDLLIDEIIAIGEERCTD